MGIFLSSWQWIDIMPKMRAFVFLPDLFCSHMQLITFLHPTTHFPYYRRVLSSSKFDFILKKFDTCHIRIGQCPIEL